VGVRGVTTGLSVLVLSLVLAGCAEAGGGPSVTTPPSATSGERPAVSPLGVPVGLSAADGRSVSVTVEAVDVTATCPGRSQPTLRAELGYFVVLDVTVRVDVAPTTATVDALPMSAEDFAVVDAGGSRQPISSTPTSWACFEDAELLEPFVAGGGTARGKVVLDSRTGDGAVVLELPGVGTAAWAF